MPRNAPAILPNHPKRPNMRNAAAINPAILSPDTLPLPRLRKKLPNISESMPRADSTAAGSSAQKIRYTVQFFVDTSHRTAYRTDRFPGFVFHLTHIVCRACDSVSDGFADNGITHDTDNAFVGGQFFPTHITDRSADGCGFDGLTCAA